MTQTVPIEYADTWPRDCLGEYEGWDEFDFLWTACYDGWPGEDEFFSSNHNLFGLEWVS